MSTPPIILGAIPSRAIATVCLLLGACFAAISIFLLYLPKLQADPDLSIITFPVTFGVFFLFLAWRFWQSAGKTELAPTSHWRLLGFGLLGFALISMLLWNWVVALFPFFVGGFCLLKVRAIDDRITKILWWIP